MATTTNYGWETPDDTDLVKDGASAIRTLGSAIDTTTKALNPETTLGDISYRSSTANTNTRLAIGTTGQVLTVSGGVPAWSTISAGGMTLLSTTSLSGTSTTVSSISGSYTNLFILVRGFTFNANACLKVSFNSGSIPMYGQAAGAVFAPTSIIGTYNSQTAPGSTTNSFAIFVNNYASSSYHKPVGYYGNQVPSEGPTYAWGYSNQTAAITQVVVGTVAGTSTFSTGEILIYGVN